MYNHNDTTAVSNSMINMLLNEPYNFDRFMKGEYQSFSTEPMTFGTAFHFFVLSHVNGKDLDEGLGLALVPDYNRRTNKGKEAYSELIEQYPDGSFITKSAYDNAERLAEQTVNNKYFKEYIAKLKSEYALGYEEEFTSDYNGLKLRGKMDLACYNIDGELAKVVDLKTTSDISGFRYSAYKYGYHRQSCHYTLPNGLQLEDNVFDFLAVDKTFGTIKVFKTRRPEYIEKAKDAFAYGLSEMKYYLENGLRVEEEL